MVQQQLHAETNKYGKDTSRVGKTSVYPIYQGPAAACARVDIIWVEHVPNSLKATTKEKGGSGVFSLCQKKKKQKEFLCVDANKKELFGFLANTDSPCRFWPRQGEQVLCSPLQPDTIYPHSL